MKCTEKEDTVSHKGYSSDRQRRVQQGKVGVVHFLHPHLCSVKDVTTKELESKTFCKNQYWWERQ